MSIQLNFKADLRSLHRAMINLGAQQIPFATSLAANSLAKGVVEVEREEIAKTFDTPTPFTQNAYRIEVATKSRPIAVVAAKDIQAEYLEPYVHGGDRYLGTKRGMIAPRGVTLNQYGNLPKSKLQTLRAKPNVYVGPIKTRSGKVINGVWQRGRPKASASRRKASAAPKGNLKLLIQFEDTTPAPKRLDFYGRARAYVQRNAAREFAAGLSRALATARR